MPSPTSGALSQKPSVPFARGRSALCTERTGKIRKYLVISGPEKRFLNFISCFVCYTEIVAAYQQPQETFELLPINENLQ